MTEPDMRNLARTLSIPFDRDCDLESENRCYDAIAALLTAVRADALALVAEREQAARREGAIAMAKRAVFAAKSACRAGEKCMDDGGCRHVPCITARMIAADIESLIAEPLAAPPQPERTP